MSDAIDRLRLLARAYAARERIDLAAQPENAEYTTLRYLLFGQFPVWTAAGLLDWYWHKRSDLEHTAGTAETALHLMMFAEAGLPVTLALFCEINAGLLTVMAAGALVHELTAFVDVGYAEHRREVTSWEQHTHSFLEVLPFTALAVAVCLHANQAAAGARAGRATDFALRLRERRLSGAHFAYVGVLLLAGVVVPYGNELWRCVRARRR